MRIALVGADFEENLGVGLIAAVAVKAGHSAQIVPFNTPSDVAQIVQSVLQYKPDVVGLSIQFQHRAAEFLGLARSLRAAGFAGHMTCGGQFPTLAWQEVLEPRNGMDTVVLHDGEHTFAELLKALTMELPLAGIAGLALRGPDGTPMRTAGRRLEDDLDVFPFPVRYRPHNKHLGVDFVPIMGGRGCWGNCSYCSITSHYRDARAHGGGRTVRLRTPENIAAEMAMEYHRAGNACVFCFHDDNLLLPRPSDTLTRIRALREALDEYDVGPVGLIGKCRPDCVTPELAKELRSLGVLRLYVGVENAAGGGADHLHRTSQTRCVDEALKACREAGIFVCYNLLLFEPDATLEDVRENIRFIRDHAEHPVNFCRAEPYYGTPLHRDLETRQKLGGSYLGWNYRIEDTRTELLFRICSAAFRQRNFDPEGVGNRYMSLGYSARLLEFYYPEREGRRAKLMQRAADLTRAIATDTAEWLEQALELATTLDPHDEDKILRETALLGLRIAAADAVWHAALDEIQAAMTAYTVETQTPIAKRTLPQKLNQWFKRAAMSATVAAWATTVVGCSSVVDPVPGDVLTDRSDISVVDPPPPDARDVPVDMFVVDPAPVDIIARDAAMDVPPDMTVVDPPPADAGVPVGFLDDEFQQNPNATPESAGNEPPRRRLAVIDQWRDTTPDRAVRTRDLPLWAPPAVTLQAERQDDHWVVRVLGAPRAVTTRWESFGEITGDGCEVQWMPRANDDQLRVAVRSHGGVAVLALRASELRT